MSLEGCGAVLPSSSHQLANPIGLSWVPRSSLIALTRSARLCFPLAHPSGVWVWGRDLRGLKNSPLVEGHPDWFFLFSSVHLRTRNESSGPMPAADKLIQKITLGGGSLGSPVDEERSQLREPMRIAGHNEHQYFERTLRPSFLDVATSVRGSL